MRMMEQTKSLKEKIRKEFNRNNQQKDRCNTGQREGRKLGQSMGSYGGWTEEGDSDGCSLELFEDIHIINKFKTDKKYFDFLSPENFTATEQDEYCLNAVMEKENLKCAHLKQNEVKKCVPIKVTPLYEVLDVLPYVIKERPYAAKRMLA
jgi:hypothetical protein